MVSLLALPRTRAGSVSTKAWEGPAPGGPLGTGEKGLNPPCLQAAFSSGARGSLGYRGFGYPCPHMATSSSLKDLTAQFLKTEEQIRQGGGAKAIDRQHE